jgi:hypothetical protein
VSVSALLDAALGATQGDFLYRGASTWSVLAPGTSGQVLQSGGTGANPAWASLSGLGTVTQIVAGAGLAGGTITSTGTLSLGTIAATTLMGNSGTVGAVAGGIPLGAGLSFVSGSLVATSSGSGTVTQIVAGAGLAGGTISASGTLSLATIAAGDLLANTGTVAAVPAATSLTALIDDVLGANQGNVLFRGATAWTVLAPGTSGQFLQTQGTGANPAWATVSGGSGTWNAGTVNAIGGALSLTSGTLVGTGSSTLAGDTDVAFTSPQAGDRIRFDGTHWVNGREPYVIAGFVPGTLTAGQTLVASVLSEAVTWPANFGTCNSGAVSFVKAANTATAAVTLAIKQCPGTLSPAVSGNWSQIGTITTSAGGYLGALLTNSGSVVTGAAGDCIEIVTTGTGTDATYANLMFAIAGDR